LRSEDLKKGQYSKGFLAASPITSAFDARVDSPVKNRKRFTFRFCEGTERLRQSVVPKWLVQLHVSWTNIAASA